MNSISIGRARLLLGSAVVLATCAQLLFRTVMQQFGALSENAEFHIIELLQSMSASSIILLVIGLFFYAGSMVAWVPALSRIDVSVAYPVLAMSYVLVYALAIHLPWLNEAASPMKLAGIATILIGVGLVATSSSQSRSDPSTH